MWDAPGRNFRAPGCDASDVAVELLDPEDLDERLERSDSESVELPVDEQVDELRDDVADREELVELEYGEDDVRDRVDRVADTEDADEWSAECDEDELLDDVDDEELLALSGLPEANRCARSFSRRAVRASKHTSAARHTAAAVKRAAWCTSAAASAATVTMLPLNVTINTPPSSVKAIVRRKPTMAHVVSRCRRCTRNK